MAAPLRQLLSFFFWAFVWLAGSATSLRRVRGGGFLDAATVAVDGRHAVAGIDDDFICATLDWWPPEKCDYGTCSWGRASLLNLDLSNKILLNAVKAFTPLKIRLGGTLQDIVIYETSEPGQHCTPFVKNTSVLFGFSQGCLPLHRWDELNEFFQTAGAKVIFGLNALNGRVPLSDGSLGGPWDSTNAASLIRYTVGKGYNAVYGWEFGNELSGNGVGTRVNADQYASDVANLKNIVDASYQDCTTKPLLLAPGGFFDSNWFNEFIRMTPPGSVDVVTHHIYNLGPGVDTHLIDKILDPSYLDGEASTFSNLQSLLQGSGTSAVAWVGEAGGAYNSGHHLVTDSFVFSFWYLDQLGMAAKFDTKSYCRQSLIGGNYGLLNTTTFVPNPDYYSALLWHRLMGKAVLSAVLTDSSNSTKLRAYAHCAKTSNGIVLLLINLSGNTTSSVLIAGGNHAFRQAQLRKQTRPGDIARHGRGHGHGRAHGLAQAVGQTREEYHLTPKDGNIQSQQVLLNGRTLTVGPDDDIPALEPVEVPASVPVTVLPYSIVFVHLPSFYAPACEE